MTDQPTNNPFTAPGHGAAKGAALGMGVLLLLGTAMMIVLLILREPEVEIEGLPPVALEPGERVTDISLREDRALFLIDHEDGSQRVLLMDFTTGEGKTIEIFAR